MKVKQTRVGDLAEQIRGVTFDSTDASSIQLPGYLPVLRAGNIGSDGLVFQDLVFVPATRISAKQLLRRYDVVVAASSGSISVVGKAAPVLDDYTGSFGAFCKVLRPGPSVHPGYFAHFFKTHDYRRRVSALAAGVNINNLRNEHLDDMEIPLPSPQDQRRIAEVLDRAEALQAKRRAAIAHLDTLTQSIFLDIFGDPVTNPKGWPEGQHLGDVANIVSGITKGRKVNGAATREVPYLAVVNVQDRRLELTMVKTIEATESEIDQYRLRKGDLLLTEGGDPDKLGRGALWAEEIPECIHQNHIFRVRLVDTDLTPVYLNWLVGSQRGKRYFLKSAKQTTGIASINQQQLRAFPLLIPPLPLQNEFAAIIDRIFVIRGQMRASLQSFDSCFASLQQRAFRGEL